MPHDRQRRSIHVPPDPPRAYLDTGPDLCAMVAVVATVFVGALAGALAGGAVADARWDGPVTVELTEDPHDVNGLATAAAEIDEDTVVVRGVDADALAGDAVAAYPTTDGSREASAPRRGSRCVPYGGGVGGLLVLPVLAAVAERRDPTRPDDREPARH